MRSCFVCFVPLFVCAASALAQAPRVPFEAAHIAFPSSTSIVSTGDFDADGHVDALGWYWTLNTYTHAVVRTYRNDGAGNFSAFGPVHSVYVNTNQTWDVQVGQLDRVPGDDWIAVFHDEILLSTGVRTTLAAPVAKLALIDYDADGLDDVVAMRSGAVDLYHNLGALGFELEDSLPVAAASEMHVAELNGDAIQDVVCASSQQLSLVYVQNGALVAGAVLPVTSIPSEAVMFVAGDIDGDHDDDIVAFIDGAGGTPERAEYITWRRISAQGFQVEGRVEGGPATGLADIDGDGDLDGVCCGSGGPLTARNSARTIFHLSINEGGGRFAKAWTINGLGAFRFAGAVDVDGDGDRDLVAGRAVFLNQSGFRVDPQPDGPALAHARAVFDADGDGDPDLGEGLTVRRENNGMGQLRMIFTVTTGLPSGIASIPGFPIAGDFDGDGDQDFIIRYHPNFVFGNMRLLRNNGGGAYVDGGLATDAGVDFSNWGSNPYTDLTTLVADVDGDGDQDVIISNRTGLIVFRVWANDGNGWFTLRQMTFGSAPVRVLDIDGDGNLDLVTVDSIHFGLGDGTLAGRSATRPTGAHRAGDHVAIGDLDGDGRMDIVWCERFSNVLYVLWNQGQRQFISDTIPLPYALSNSTSDTMHTLILDADGDGQNDVLLGPTLWYEGPNQLLLFGNHTRSLSGRSEMLAMDLGPLADIDGDGDLDIVAQEMVRSSRAVLPADGLRLQYGLGTVGTGQMMPQLGARGPFHAGTNVELRISGAVGGAPGLLLIGIDRVNWINWPLPGLEGYVAPLIALPFALTGTPGEAGAGSLRWSIFVPYEFSGAQVFHQAFFADAQAPHGLTQSCGLQLQYR